MRIAFLGSVGITKCFNSIPLVYIVATPWHVIGTTF